MSDDKRMAQQMDIEAKYEELRQTVADLAQYAAGLADPSSADAMIVWLMKEHKELVASAFAAYAYGQEARRLYTDLLAEHGDLLTALAEGDTDNAVVADALDSARNDGEKHALTGLILRIAAAQGIAGSDVSQLLNALEHPDRVSPFFADRLADRLRQMADRLDTTANENAQAS